MIAYQRTGKIESADDVTNVKVERLPATEYNNAIRLSWVAPQNPNGMIISYNIRYVRGDINYAKSQEICLPHNLYRQQGNSHIITDLVNGNYIFTVVANSFAGLNNRWSSPVNFDFDE